MMLPRPAVIGRHIPPACSCPTGSPDAVAGPTLYMPEDANMKKSAKSRRGFSSHVLALAIICSAWPLATRVRGWVSSFDFHGADVELGPWYTSGPLKASSFAESFFPEQGVDLQAKSPEGQPRWRPRPEWADGQVHMLDGSDRVSTYLSRTLKVPAALAVEASLGSDDGCELWLNDQKLLSHDIPRTGARPGSSDSEAEAGGKPLAVQDSQQRRRPRLLLPHRPARLSVPRATNGQFARAAAGGGGFEPHVRGAVRSRRGVLEAAR